MPHKRAKRSVREHDRSARGSDLAPVKDSLSHEAIPKGAARILNAEKVQQDWKDRKRKRAEASEDGPRESKRQRAHGDEQGGRGGGGRHSDTIKIQPGESLAHFNRRVEESMRPLMRDAIQSSAVMERKARKEQEAELAAKHAKTKSKAKANAYTTKATTGPTKDEKADQGARDISEDDAPLEAAKSGKSKENGHRDDFATYSASAPRRLNDIVQAPPELKRLPRGAKRDQSTKAENKGSHSLKEGALSMAQKVKLEEERERAIKAYRELRGRTTVG